MRGNNKCIHKFVRGKCLKSNARSRKRWTDKMSLGEMGCNANLNKLLQNLKVLILYVTSEIKLKPKICV